MNYGQILKHSWELLKSNKFLWGLGILAGLVSGGGGIPSFNFPSNIQRPEPTPAVKQTWPPTDPISQNPDAAISNFGRVLDEVIKGNMPISELLSSGIVLAFLAIVVVAVLIWLAVIYFGLSARAGLILAVDKLETIGEKMTFSTALRDGKKYFWPIFRAGLFFFLYTVVFISFLGMLGLVGWIARSGPVTGLLVVLGVLLVIVFIVSAIYLGILYLFVSQLIVLDNLKALNAIKKAHVLMKRNWRDILISWIILIGVGMAAGLVIVLTVFAGLAVFVPLGFGAYYATKSMTVVVVSGGVIGLVLFAALLFVRGIITAYVMIYTTLVYRALRYIDNQKI